MRSRQCATATHATSRRRMRPSVGEDLPPETPQAVRTPIKGAEQTAPVPDVDMSRRHGLYASYTSTYYGAFRLVARSSHRSHLHFQ